MYLTAVGFAGASLPLQTVAHLEIEQSQQSIINVYALITSSRIVQGDSLLSIQHAREGIT